MQLAKISWCVQWQQAFLDCPLNLVSGAERKKVLNRRNVVYNRVKRAMLNYALHKKFTEWKVKLSSDVMICTTLKKANICIAFTVACFPINFSLQHVSRSSSTRDVCKRWIKLAISFNFLGKRLLKYRGSKIWDAVELFLYDIFLFPLQSIIKIVQLGFLCSFLLMRCYFLYLLLRHFFS